MLDPTLAAVGAYTLSTVLAVVAAAAFKATDDDSTAINTAKKLRRSSRSTRTPSTMVMEDGVTGFATC